MLPNALSALFKQFQDETQGQVSTPQGGLTPPGQFGTQTVAPPASMLGPVNQSPFQQAAAMPDAPEVRPTLGTRDLPAALLALLAGNQGGQVIQGYLGGKVQQAGQQTQRNQNEVDRKRQALILQGKSQQEAAALASEEAQKGLDRKSRENIAGVNVDGRMNVAELKAQTDLKKAEYTYQGAKLKSEDLRFGKELAAQSSDVKTAFSTLMKLPEKARPGFAKVIRSNFEQFADWDDDALNALATSTAKEESDRARADELKAQVGYLGIRGRDIQNKSAAERESIRVRSNLWRADTAYKKAQTGLMESQTELIDKKVKNYEPEMRARAARYTAATLKGAGSNDLKDLSVRRAGWAGLYRTATDQINKIRKDNKGEPPMLAFDPDGFAAYMKVVQDQEEARKNLDEIDKIKTKGLNPVTSGRVLPGGQAPMTINPGQIRGVGGGGYQPNTTSGGVKWRKLPQ